MPSDYLADRSSGGRTAIGVPTGYVARDHPATAGQLGAGGPFSGLSI